MTFGYRMKMIIMRNLIKTSISRFLLLVLAGAILLGTTPVAKATTTSSNVAIVPDPVCAHGGTLPTTDAAFAAFTFTNLAWAAVDAASLAAYDTVVLLIETSTVPLTSSQKTDLINWVNGGGKLIIYDSETVPGVDYSWLPYPMTTENPGAIGYGAGDITYLEDNSLGSTTLASPYYIDITIVPTGGWSDAVGDCNVFVTYDPNWCGDIQARNWYSYPDSPGYDGSPAGWVHTYAPYGDGLMIYNGFDIDPLSSGTTPSTTGVGNLAKIWLMELEQPWGDDYNLPCQRRVAPEEAVGGEIIPINMVRLILPYLLMLTIAVGAAGILNRKKIL